MNNLNVSDVVYQLMTLPLDLSEFLGRFNGLLHPSINKRFSFECSNNQVTIMYTTVIREYRVDIYFTQNGNWVGDEKLFILKMMLIGKVSEIIDIINNIEDTIKNISQRQWYVVKYDYLILLNDKVRESSLRYFNPTSVGIKISKLGI